MVERECDREKEKNLLLVVQGMIRRKKEIRGKERRTQKHAP